MWQISRDSGCGGEHLAFAHSKINFWPTNKVLRCLSSAFYATDLPSFKFICIVLNNAEREYCIFSDWLGPDKEPHGGDGKVRYIGRFGEFAGKIATIREARFPINVRIYVHHLIMCGSRYRGGHQMENKVIVAVKPMRIIINIFCILQRD